MSRLRAQGLLRVPAFPRHREVWYRGKEGILENQGEEGVVELTKEGREGIRKQDRLDNSAMALGDTEEEQQQQLMSSFNHACHELAATRTPGQTAPDGQLLPLPAPPSQPAAPASSAHHPLI